ncbi:MAG: RNA recognition motif domain-containing protein [Nitrosotalea sp.]
MKGGKAMKNLFIGGLSHGVTNFQLEEHFTKVGKVVSAKVIIDRQTGLGKGFGFVEMETEEEAKKAMKELNHTEIDGKIIEVKEAKSRE